MAGMSTYQRREGVPRPEGEHKSGPRKEEDAAVFVKDIEDRDGVSLPVDRVDVRGPPEVGELHVDTHRGGCNRQSV